MAKLIGTAGHVDHGKTTLIRALTGIDADRLPEEKKRGMTIDIGFAYLDLPEVGRVSIVDVPGHEKFIHNMLVGALGIDVALLCVAADAGVMPQTTEHLQILDLLPVERMVVALTRADLVDAETCELATMDVRQALEGTKFEHAAIYAVSAVTGDGLSALRDALVGELKAASDKREGPWYLPIDRAFLVKGRGVVATGTLAQGTVRVGDVAFLEPGRIEVRVRGIHAHGDAHESSEYGRRTAINLSGIHLEDVRRGMAVGAEGALFETRTLDAKIRWLVKVKHGTRVRVSIGAEEAMARVFLSDQDPEIVQLRLETAIAVARQQPLILRRYSPMELLGGGHVVVPLAKVRRKSEAALVRETPTSDDDALLGALGERPDGLITEELARMLGKSVSSLSPIFDQLQKDGRVRGFSGRWFSEEGWQEAVQRLASILGELHERAPHQATHPRERVVEKAGFTWSGKPLDRILAAMAQDGHVVVEGSALRLPSFVVQLNPKQRQLLDRVRQVLRDAGVNVPAELDIARTLGIPPQAVEEIVKLGLEAKELVRIGPGLVYDREGLETIQTTVRKAFEGKSFGAAEFRDLLSTSRKYAIPLLEYFDSIRLTLRQGDQRVIARRSEGSE